MHSAEQYYFIDKFDKKKITKQNKKTSIIYRNYRKKLDFSEMQKMNVFCKKRGLKLYLSNNVKLALKLDLHGAYIPSFNKCLRHLSYLKKTDFNIIGSAHNLKEIRIKELQGASRIFVSSIFKDNKNYLGKFRFLNLTKLTKKKVIALGGISKENLRLVKLINVSGFAGISFFE